MARVLLNTLQSVSDGICKVLDRLVEDDEEDCATSTPSASARAHEESAAPPLPPPPRLLGIAHQPATFLGREQLGHLRRTVPLPLGQGGAWRLLYRGNRHRLGPRALYDRMEGRRNLLFVLRTPENTTIGAFAPNAPNAAAMFFHSVPEFWHATVPDSGVEFLQTRPNGIGFVAPFGGPKLWLDKSLRSGHMSGSWGPGRSEGPFEIEDLEVWAVISPPCTPPRLSSHDSETDHSFVMLQAAFPGKPTKCRPPFNALVCSIPMGRSASGASSLCPSRCSSRSETPLLPRTPSSIADSGSLCSYPSDSSEYILIEHFGA